MGTSKRNINKKIVEFLKGKQKEDCSKIIPEVAVEVLNNRESNSLLSNTEFEVVLSCGLTGYLAP